MNKTLVKELDKVFSKYIRILYNIDGFVKCFTCDKQLLIIEAQNGHFISRKYYATRWSIDNCRPQCDECNTYKGGNLEVFKERLLQDIGIKRYNTLMQRKDKIVKYSDDYLRGLIYKYKRLNKLWEAQQ